MKDKIASSLYRRRQPLLHPWLRRICWGAPHLAFELWDKSRWATKTKRERPKEANSTARAVGASACMANARKCGIYDFLAGAAALTL